MKLGVKFSLITVIIVVVLSILLEAVSLLVFSGAMHALNKDLFAEKLNHLVAQAYEQDELFFEGVYHDIIDGQVKVITALDTFYRNHEDPITFPFIVDTQGRIVSHPAVSRWRLGFEHHWEKGETMFQKEQLDFMRARKEGEFRYDSPKDIPRWFVFKTYGPWNWIFCMTTSMEVLWKPVRSFIRFAMFVSVFVIILSVLATLTISQRFIQPIHSVIERLNKIAKGEVARDESLAHVKPNDEIGMLARAVQEMARNLETTTVSRDTLVQEMAERKRLEHMMLQSEKMSAIGQLAGGVAHEINNPLGVILGFAQNVVKRITPGDPLEMPLKSIEREAVRCKNLVQDLLTFSRVGKSEKELLDIQEAIEGALTLVLAQSKVKSVELVKEFEEVPKMNANRTQIQQVIVNLCNNAIDAMPNGGRLAIRVEKTKIDGREGIQIRVQDTGQGIPKEIQSKIFNPFFTTKEIGKGTGLGLSLVYEIVQKHGGQILLDSEIGKGASFRVLLPINL